MATWFSLYCSYTGPDESIQDDSTMQKIIAALDCPGGWVKSDRCISVYAANSYDCDPDIDNILGQFKNVMASTRDGGRIDVELHVDYKTYDRWTVDASGVSELE